MYKIGALGLCALFWTFSLATIPSSTRFTETNTNIDCTRPIAFSLTGSGPIQCNGLVVYKKNHVSLDVTWNNEVGIFTCSCSGLYQFSFSGSIVENTRMELKKKLNNGKQWIPILGTKPGGGSATILLEVENGDQVAIFLNGSSKKFNTRHLQGTDITSFSGYMIAIK